MLQDINAYHQLDSSSFNMKMYGMIFTSNGNAASGMLTPITKTNISLMWNLRSPGAANAYFKIYLLLTLRHRAVNEEKPQNTKTGLCHLTLTF